MSRHATAPRRSIALALVTVWVTTGGNFVAFKVALETIPPLIVMTTRLLGAGIVLLALTRFRGPLDWPTRGQLVSAIAAGSLLLVLGQGGIVWGLQYLPAGSSAVFASASPLFLVAFESLLLRQRLAAPQVIGTVLGFAGLLMMTMLSSGDSARDPAAIGFILAGSASWALGSLFENRANLPPDAMLTGALEMLWAGCAMSALTLLSGELTRVELHDVSDRSIVGLIYLVVVGMAVSFGTFVWLNGVTTPTLANTFHYVSPVVALGVAFWIFDEPIGWGKASSALVVLAGVAFIVSVRDRKPDQKEHRR